MRREDGSEMAATMAHLAQGRRDAGCQKQKRDGPVIGWVMSRVELSDFYLIIR